jgi:hypothetical protein
LLVRGPKDFYVDHFARALSMPMCVRREAAVGQGVTVKVSSP